jgi:hypothetical protein
MRLRAGSSLGLKNGCTLDDAGLKSPSFQTERVPGFTINNHPSISIRSYNPSSSEQEAAAFFAVTSKKS